jgi:hypothetical protein
VILLHEFLGYYLPSQFFSQLKSLFWNFRYANKLIIVDPDTSIMLEMLVLPCINIELFAVVSMQFISENALYFSFPKLHRNDL